MQVDALLRTLELQESAQRKGHFALLNCLVIGYTKYKGVHRVSPDSVKHAQVLLLFSASAMTDTGSKSFECALISTLETYDDTENGKDDYFTHYSK